MSKPVPKRCRRRLPLALLLCLPTLLTGCAGFNDDGAVQLPPDPPDLTDCTDAAVPGLPGAAGTAWNTADAVGIIGDQRRVALGKDKCARNWRSFYGDLRSRLAKTGH